MSSYLHRLGRWAFRRRRYVVSFWVFVLLAIVALSVAGGGKTVNDFSIPGTPSAQGIDLLKERLPAAAGAQSQAVFAVTGTAKLTDPAVQAGIEASLEQMRHSPQVAAVVDPYQTKTIAPGGQVGYAAVQYGVGLADIQGSALDALSSAADPARAAGVQVEFGGQVYPGFDQAVSEVPEIIGIVVAFLILLVAFGALVAAGLPILTAIVGVVIALMGVSALAAVTEVQSATTSLAVMLSLACGIDYALFILTRHRTNVLQGMAIEDSVALAVGTSGGAVVFAGLTVVIALCGLSVVGIPFLTIMGLTAAVAVLLAVLLSLTLLPALLGFAGHKVAKFVTSPVPGREPEQIARTAAEEPGKTAGARWARFVVRFRVPLVIVGVVGMLVLAIPTLSMQLGLPTGDSRPTSNTAYKAFHLIEDGFGPGFNGPLTVIADTSGARGPQAVGQVVDALGREAGVTTVAIAAPPQNSTALITVIPKTGPTDPQTTELVKQIRTDAGAIQQQTGIQVLVVGQTATNIDATDKLSAALPVFLAIVIGLAFILLTIAFRTIVVPLKSIIGFLLSVGVAFGAQVAVFQWGWARQIFGITPTDTLSFLPIILLAIIFGLSSDYEVFVVSRIKEQFAKTGDGVVSVERGLGLSVRVISAAALIMFSVFLAFTFTPDPVVKAIGFSLAVGVLVDAFIVRMTIVPAVMAILKGRVWYHPRWFARVVPDLDIEGEKLERELGNSTHEQQPVGRH